MIEDSAVTKIGVVLLACAVLGAGTGVAWHRWGPDPQPEASAVSATTTPQSPQPSQPSPSPSQEATASASSTPATPSGTPSPRSAPRPAPQPSTSPTPAAASGVSVPDGALLVGRDLTEARLGRDFDSGQYLKVPTTATSVCRTEPLGLQDAVGGRSVQWSGPDVDPAVRGSWTLSNAVRVFSGSGAADQLRWLRRNLATCTGVWGPMTAVRLDRPDAAMAYSTSTPGSVLVLAAVRVGQATSGFELFVPVARGADPAERVSLATATARRLLDTARQRLVSSGLGDTAG